ncbi:MAG: hypothetical protein HYZ86_02715 [Candidatus Omnitrophica bacterium]|nr:hypothetical protein [Candidatus Omnitrophota bacterium]
MSQTRPAVGGARDLWPALSLVLVGCLFYANAVAHPFVHDDLVFIVRNPAISRLDNIAGIFLGPSGAAGINTYYRPVLELVDRLEYRFFGLDPSGYHAFNVLVHAANGVLVFFLLSRLGASRALAWGLSAIFLVHPAQSESVACIAGISNLASAFFILTCLYFYASRRTVWAMAAFVFGLFTKESTVVLPLLLIVMDRLYIGGSIGRTWTRAGPFAALASVFLVLRQYLTGADLAGSVLASPGELTLRILAIPRTLLTYGKIIAWPDDLHYYRNTDILAPNAWAFALLGLIILTGFWWFRRLNANDKRTVVFGAGWFFLFLLPVLNVVPLINEYSFILTAEHFLYLPIIGVLLIGAVVLSRWTVSSSVRKGLFAVVFAAFGVTTIGQNTFWKGEVPLFERMVRFEPRFGRGHILLAKAYDADHRYDLAKRHYMIALDIMQGYAARARDTTARDVYLGFIRDIQMDLTRLEKFHLYDGNTI